MIWAKNENLYADEFIEHTLLILTELLLNSKSSQIKLSRGGTGH